MSIRITFEGNTAYELHSNIFKFMGVQNPADIAPDAQPVPALLEQPATAKRGRKPKAAAPETTSAGQPNAGSGGAATLDSAPTAAAPNPAPASSQGVAREITQSSPVVATGAGTPLGPDAVAPGGAVFLAVKAFNDKHGMEKARELLAKFGAGMVRQIKPADYAAVIAACAA